MFPKGLGTRGAIMSLGVVIKGTQGVVLAADSRVTLEARRPNLGHPIPVNFDNASKLLTFSKPHNYVAAVTYGAAVIGLRTAHSFVPAFEQSVLTKCSERQGVKKYAEQLSEFFMDRWRESVPPDYHGPNMTFIVGGYDPKAAYGKVFLFEIPGKPEPEPRNAGENEFGMTWGGQLEVASRIIHGFDPTLPQVVKKVLGLHDQEVNQLTDQLHKALAFPIPYEVLPLQDCIDLTIFLIRSTMGAQNLAVGVRGVGGPIEVAVITQTEGLEFIQRKKLHGEENVEGR